MNRQQKEIIKEVVLLLAMLLFIMFGVKACVLSENEYLLEQDRIRAEKREMWLEAQTKQSSSTE